MLPEYYQGPTPIVTTPHTKTHLYTAQFDSQMSDDVVMEDPGGTSLDGIDALLIARDIVDRRPPK